MNHTASHETRPQRRPRADGERTRSAILRAAASLATVDGLEGLSIGHLAALGACGFVTGRKRGRRIRCDISRYVRGARFGD